MAQPLDLLCIVSLLRRHLDREQILEAHSVLDVADYALAALRHLCSLDESQVRAEVLFDEVRLVLALREIAQIARLRGERRSILRELPDPANYLLI